MAMTFNTANVRWTTYEATWDEGATLLNLGGIDGVQINIDEVWSPLKIGSAGIMKLDDRFSGLSDDSHVIVVVREVTLAAIRRLVPWAASSGAADMAPAVGTMVAQYAKLLNLHPNDVVGTTEDVQFFKACPVQSFKLARGNNDFDRWAVRFNIYPDQTKLKAGTNCYYQIKGA